MVRNTEDAVQAALAQKTNVPGTCQMTVRNWFDAPSVGDVDGDRDADAVDGWKSEPQKAQHPNDRNAPRGYPVAWSGGSKGYGHRAISLGKRKGSSEVWIRTTDGGGNGTVADRPLSWVEKTWGLTYLGWSETISGIPIPTPPKPEPEPKPKTSRGKYVDHAIEDLKKTTARTPERKKLKEQALKTLLKMPLIK